LSREPFIALGIAVGGTEGGQKFPHLGPGESFVNERLDERQLLGTLGDRIRRHVCLLIPAEKSADMDQKTDLSVNLDKSLKFRAHGTNRNTPPWLRTRRRKRR
jgi:hypothetical protein